MPTVKNSETVLAVKKSDNKQKPDSGTDKPSRTQLNSVDGKSVKVDNDLLCICRNVCSVDTEKVVQCDNENKL